MTIAVIDGMGGGIGTEIVSQIREAFKNKVTILALGANAMATDRMMRAKADRGASGENAIRVSVSQADIIIGPIGIVLPNAMMGEISAVIAEAVMSAKARKLLIPLNQGHIEIVGLKDSPLGELIQAAVDLIKENI